MSDRARRALRLLAALLSLAACATGATTIAPPPPGALRVASFNVHYIDLQRETGKWSVGDFHRRKPALAAAFASLDADIIAFQEMESFRRGSDGSVNLARDWLASADDAYGVAAVGAWRDFPSTQPIFYRRDRLALRDQGWFFFSETPDVIYSRTFDGSYPAFASWATFRDRETSASVTVLDVHFEYSSGSNRIRSAELVADRIEPWIAAGANVILAGDLNALAGSKTRAILERAGFDFVDIAGATYHFDMGLNLFGAIDHIGATEGLAQVGAAKVLRGRFDGVWPSDHYPVIADFALPE